MSGSADWAAKIRDGWFGGTRDGAPATGPSSFDLGFAALDPFPRVRTDEFIVCNFLSEALVDRHCWHLLRAFDVPLEDQGGHAPGADTGGPSELPGNVVAERRVVWDFAVQRLRRRAMARVDPESGALLVTSAPDDTSLDDLLADCADSPSIRPMVELVALAAETAPAFLRGECEGEDRLLTPTAVGLWQRYFDNQNVHYGTINEMTARVFVDRLTDAGIDLLEVGGGFGSAAIAVLEAAGRRIGSYRFSERVPFFVSGARRRVVAALGESEALERVTFEKLDIERPLVAQGIENASVDTILAVNVLHAVRDLRSALVGLRDALRPGGRIMLGEAVRRRADVPVAVEFVFQMTRPFRDFQPEPWRPHGGFLLAENWIPALEAAGFTEVRISPDLASTQHLDPPFTLAVIDAVRAD